MTGIYKISSIIKEKVYIGSAYNLLKRERAHLHLLRTGKHDNKILQNHFNKYGEEDLIFSILEYTTKEEILQREQFHLDTNELPTFNICTIAGSRAGTNVSEETKIKLSKAHKGKIKTKEHLDRIVKALTGKKLSDNHRKNLSISHMGSQKGRVATAETKERMSKAQKGSKKKPLTEAHKAILREKHLGANNHFYGKTHSAEARKKISEVQKGRVSHRRILDDEQTQKVIEMYNTGLSMRAIAKLYNTDHSTISDYIKRYNSHIAL